MTPSRLVRVFFVALLLCVVPSFASAATTEFRVLFDVDDDAETGCTVNGMDGVDQVLVTQVTEGDASSTRVTRTHRQSCVGSVLGAATDIDTTGWAAGWNHTTKLLTIETRVPFSAFGSDAMPSTIHAGFDGSRNSSVHTSLANADGTPIFIPAPAVRRRAIDTGDRHITMDGDLADWGNVKPAVVGLASNGSSTLRLLRIMAWADPNDHHLYFATMAYLGSDYPYADDDIYNRLPDQSLVIGAPGVLANDAIPGGAPLTAQQVTEPARGTVTLNADGSFTYSPTHPQLVAPDEFEYKAVGGGKESNIARVIIKVGEPNENPNAPQDDHYTTPEDTNKVVSKEAGVLANDPHGELLVASLLSPPSKGTVTLNPDGGFTYKPKANYHGPDSFTYNAAKKQGAPEGIGGTATVTITVTPVNDPPVAENATFSLPENSPNNTVVGTVGAFDVDNNALSYFIQSGNTGGAFAINSSTGQIRVANSAALDFETNPTFSLTIRVEDASSSDTAIITINLTDTNEPPVVVAGGTLTYTENDPPSVINGSVTVTDTDSAQLTGATIAISNNFAAGQDVLSFTPVGAITGGFVGNTLTLTGNDTPANYQLALRSVRYQNMSDNPSTLARTITWTVTDGTFTSNPVTSTINVVAVNDAPVVTTTAGSTAFTEDGGPVVVDGGVTVSDIDNANLVSATVTITNLLNAGAETLAANTSGTSITASYVAPTLTLSGSDTLANYQQVLRTVTYDNSSQNPDTTARTISFVVNDGGLPSVAATKNVTVAALNDAPVVTTSAGTTAFIENAPPVVVDGSVTVTDVDNTNLASATVTITNLLDAGMETLAANTAGTSITAIYAAPTLTLSGSDTVANYQQVLRTVTYDNASDAPNTAVRTIAFVVNDGSVNSNTANKSVSITPANDAPTDIALSGTTVAENQPAGTAVGTFSTTDPDAGDTFTYTLVGGTGDTGNGSFQIVGNQLQTAASFDFETQNSYSIRVRSTDAGGLFFEEVFTITITDVNDAPTDIALSNATAPENQAVGTTIGNFSTTDQDAGDTFTYTLVTGAGDADNTKFQIVGDALQNAVNLDFDTQPTYSIRVRSTDAGGLFFEEVFTITLTNVNETPTDIALDNASVNENQPSGTAVGNFSTTDPDAGDTFTYTLVAGAGDTGNGSFQIVGNQLQTSATFDFEAQNSYSIRVRSTDAGGLFFEEVFTITVNNVNEAPTDIALSGNTVAENQPSGTGVGTFSTTDVDAGDTFTYTLVAGAGDTGNGSFQIVGNQLQAAASFDFETQNSYSIRVRSTDAGGLFFEEVFTITVTNANETPTDIALSNASAPENQPVGTDIGTFTTTDPDAGDTFTYTLVAGTGDTDNASFQIVGDKLQNATNLDFEAQPTYSIRVRSTDAGGLFVEEVFTITITNVNETPVDIDLSNASVAENQPSGTAVGNFSTIDPDAGDTFTYTLVAGAGDTGNASFQIVGNQLQTSATFDFETQNSYSIRVRSTDAGGLFFEEVFTITVTNANEAPTDIALSGSTVAENQAAGTGVGTFSTTDVDAGDTFTYTLVAGTGDTGNASFQIVGNQLQTAASFDFETQNSYSIRVRSTDAGGLFFEEVFTITVTNVNEAPTDIALSNATAPENQAIGTTIGNFSTTDQDAGDTFTYTLVAGTGDADNAKFQIVGDALQNAVNLDFDTQPTYSIRVRSTDAGGLFFEEVFTITLTNVNETPTDIALSNASVAENQPSGTAVGNFSTTDPDAGDTFTYTLVAGAGDTGNASFQIVGNQLQTTVTFDFEAQNSYSIRVRSTDAGGLFFEEQFTISVTNVNENPTDISLSNATAPENQPVGTDIGTFTSTDPDTGDTFTYTLVAGTGDADNASFQIVGDKLQNATNLNFEAQSSYSIRVRSTDAGGLFFEEQFTITITDANETPTDIDLSNASTPENQPVGTDIGTFTTVDPDAGDTFTYTLVAGTGDADNGSFQIVGDKLQNATNLNFEAQSTYSIRVRSTDAGGLFFEEVFTITVTDANDAPTALNLSNNSVAENQASGTTVGTFTTTDQEGGQTHTYTLVAGAGDTGNASFQIVGDQLQTSASFDFETQNSFSIRVRTTDDGVPSGFFEQVFTINVTNVNEAPTDIALSNASVAENQASGTAVGNFSTTDPDVGDTFTYTLVAGTGDTGNGSFQIVGNQLQTGASFDFEAQNSYSIRVRSTDAGGLFFEEVFTITVTNVNETPTDIALSNASINENSGVNAVIGTLSTTDPDAGDTFTYTLVAGTGSTDNALFNISGNQLRENASLNFEAQSSYSVRIRTTDAGGLFYEEAFTITVVDVNEAPTAVTDSYNAVGGTLVHIAGSVSLPAPAPVASTGDVHTTPRTTGVKANDTDPDTNPAFNTLTITFVTGNAGPVAVPGGSQVTTTTTNGSVTMHSDGSFHYTPNAGYLGADSFTYTINDGANNATGTVNITVHAPAIRYVRNNAPSAGNGTSATPHQTLAAAITASTAGELIYVMEGDGTATNYGGSNVMKLNQRLWGQGVALSVTANSVALNLIAATNRPLIGPGGGANETIRIQNDITGVDIQGLRIDGGATNAVDLTTTGAGSAGFTFANNIVTAAGQEGIDVNAGGSGTVTVGIHDNTFTTTGTAVDIARTAGTVYVTAFDDNVVTGASAGAGIAVSSNATTGLIFDAVPGGGIDAVAGGTTVIGSAGDRINGQGLTLVLVNGTLNFTDLDIFTDTGSALIATAGASGFTLTAPSGVTTLLSNAGAAIDIVGVTINLQNIALTSLNSPTRGASFDGVNGTFSTASGAIQNAGTTDFYINGGALNSTYTGTIYDNAGQLINVSNSTGGTKIFSGAIDDLDGTSDPIGGGTANNGGGISLTNNASTTIRFLGGLDLSTGGTAGIVATNSGTLEICDENPCNNAATGALVNRIVSTTGTALNVSNTTIGSGGLEFRSISSNGAASGIILNATGATGSLKVKGNGGTCTTSANCTGGAILNSTSHAVSLTTTLHPQFTRVAIQNSAGSGVKGFDVTDFTFQNSFIDNSGTGLGAETSSLAFNNQASANENNLDGNVTIINNTLQNAYFHGIDIYNHAGQIDSLTIQNNVISSTASTATSKGSGIRVVAFGSASTVAHVMDATVSGNTISNFPSGAGITMQGGNASSAIASMGTLGVPNDATKLIDINNNLIAGSSAATKMGTNAIQTSVNGVGRMNVNISGNGTVANPITNIAGNVISLSVLGNSTGTATITNNRIVANHTANFGGPLGISVGAGRTFATSDVSSLTVTIDGNNVSQTDGNGILARAVEGVSTMNVTVTNNTVAAPLGGTRPGIRVDSGDASSDAAVCLDMRSNTTAGSGGNPGIGVRRQGSVAGINTFGIEGLAAGSTNNQVEDYLGAQNPGSAFGAPGFSNDGLRTVRAIVLAGSAFESCSSAP